MNRLRYHPVHTLALVAAILVAGVVCTLPALATSAHDSFSSGLAPCPVAHCNQQLDGREGMAGGAILRLAVSTPPTTDTTFTPSPPAAFANGLGCSTGESPTQGVPSLVICALTSTAGNPAGPFLYSLTLTGATSPTFDLNWSAAPFSVTQPLTCPVNAAWAMSGTVYVGAPLIGGDGSSYVSDNISNARYAATGSNGVGACVWGVPNPAKSALVSWNGIVLPANGGSGGYPRSFELIGQGTAGPLLLVNYHDGSTVNQRALTDPGGYYVTYDTVSAVETPTGARIYDSTALCPTNGGCWGLAQAPGRLYAIDVTSPITAGGMPQMTLAYSYTFEGPSGASPMVLEPARGGAPVGVRIFFDGGGAACRAPCPAPHPTLFGLEDNCPFDSTLCDTGSLSPTNPYSPTLFLDQDFTTLGEDGICSGAGYLGIGAAAALEGPETSGSIHDPSVWAYASCGATLFRFDALTGQPWTGGGASAIDIGAFSLGGQSGYVAGSTMNTVVDSHTGDTTMFVGAVHWPLTKAAFVLALDLETGKLFWAHEGPTKVGSVRDTPFYGQFPIAETAAGRPVLIATTAGRVDGGSVLAIPLS